MKRLYLVIGLILSSVLFFQCQKEASFIGGPDAGIPVAGAPDPITSILQGNILDENNLPAAGVTITVGNKTAITNSTGYFRIADASLDKNTSLVTAEKTGYFKGYRVFAATTGTNQVVIKLVRRNLAGTITASAGGNATLTNGAKISLAANSVITATSGADYAGDVKVFASYIDPSASDIAEIVPGSLAANDKDGKRVMLASFGMLAVELESSTGEKLQIKSGSVATLTSPIPSSALSSAPATIALWYIDEQTGLWKEEGVAAKQGNSYVGDVKHFSFWNCDYPMNVVSLSLTLHNAGSLSIRNAKVKVTANSDTGVSFCYGFTDSLGQVKGYVPSGKGLLVEMLDPCNKTIHSQSIPPLSTNTDLGIITVTSTNGSILTMQGTISDCADLPIKNGYAIISFDNVIQYAATDATGQFSTSFVTCSGTPASAIIIGVDQTSEQQGSATTVMITAPVTRAENIKACGSSSAQFINYTLDAVDYNITNATSDSLNGYSITRETTKTTYIVGQSSAGNLRFTVNNVSATGTFPVQSLSVNQHNNIKLTQPFNVTITGYPATVGDFYEGTFTGKFTDTASTVIHNISSSFKVRRNN